eukprot:TRINITY_DN32044_c0_g1_i1.p1 TRINITY_DN32044_c0_g1~~TRINITY_DN32044_c0_g1_i1.p1  ORF type:complete len:803 (-),score=121.66 TRINITY_DN32044_c0_g1_i1:359-2767(-)
MAGPVVTCDVIRDKAKVTQEACWDMQRVMDSSSELLPARCPLKLHAPQEPLIEFLANGRGYDDAGVAAAVQEGNDAFGRREFGRARDMFGVAYEIGRIHYAYRPMLHDLLLRRILCHSMLGNLTHALEECEMASSLIPNEATVCLLTGVVCSKLGRADDANAAFQKAVASCRDLRDLVDCMIAFFTLQHGHCDRAAQICTQVLRRSPRYPLALLMRGDALKFNPSTWMVLKQQAAEDYASLMELDLSYQRLLTRQRPDPSRHVRAEELLLSFHPTLQKQNPRPYFEYACCRRRDPFFVTGLVMFAVSRLRFLSRSSKIARTVQGAYEQILEQRSQLERKVRKVVDTHLRISASSQAYEVYGPCDQEHETIRKYRRYWMEMPSPPSASRSTPAQASRLAGPAAKYRSELMHLAQQAVEAVDVPSPPVPTFGGYTGTLSDGAAPHSTWTERRQVQTFPARSLEKDERPQSSSRHYSGLTNISACGSPGTSALPHFTPAVEHTSQEACGTGNGALHLEHASWGSNSGAAWSSNLPEEGPQGPLASSPPEASMPRVWAQQGSAHCSSLPSRAKQAVYTGIVDEPAAPPRLSSPSQGWAQDFQPLGQGWDEKQWFNKASEFIETFSGGAARFSQLNAGQKTASMVASPLPSSTQSAVGAQDAKATSLKYRSAEGRTVEVNLLEALDNHGLEVLGDWYNPLDRVYEVRDMTRCYAPVEPLVPLHGLAGAPGHSYVVSGKSRRRQGSVSARGSQGPRQQEETLFEEQSQPDEETVQRHSGRLMATALPGAGRAPEAPLPVLKTETPDLK